MSISDNNIFLLGALKRPKNTCSNYMIRSDKDLNVVKKDSGYIGKLKANFFGTEFNIYNSGKNPKKTKVNDEMRMNIGAIIYVKFINLFFLRKLIFLDLKDLENLL